MSTELLTAGPSPQPSLTVRSPEPALGSPRAWAFDLAFVGAVTTLSLAVSSPIAMPTLLVAACFGTIGGAVIGFATPALFHRRVRRVPVLLLLAAGCGLGALWLGVAGGAAALFAMNDPFVAPMPWWQVVGITASAGAAQLGWLWLPMLLRRSKARSVHRWVALACALAPLIGYAATRHALG
ncbi:MAG: hypothetical protein AB7S26_31710 [Sandaracinaceae bacterium]